MMAGAGGTDTVALFTFRSGEARPTLADRLVIPDDTLSPVLTSSQPAEDRFTLTGGGGTECLGGRGVEAGDAILLADVALVMV